MTIKEINDFQIRGTMEQPDETPKVVIENTELKKQVEVLGSVLEAQYSVENNFLVLVTEGNPFEEALYIYYFDDCLQLIDALELSAMYSEGMLRDISVVSSNSLAFSFFDKNERWILEILSRPKYFCSNKYPVKRTSSIFSKKWLKLMRS
jgi:hypothetical protein